VDSIILGNESSTTRLEGTGGNAILDTGTNVLLVPTSAMKTLEDHMCADTSLAHCHDLWSDKCVALKEEEVNAYPPLSLQLVSNNGIKLEMSPRDYLLLGSPLASSPGQYCLGVRDGGSAGGSGFIIGDTIMRNYYLVFDLVETRIGWGKVNEATCGSI